MTNMKLTLDIASEICQQLSPGPPPDMCREPLPSAKIERMLSQMTLARLARVCRMFNKPALDVLWSAIDDPRHVLRILPTFKEVSLTERTLDWLFEPRSPNDEEWARFKEYAWRVRDMRALVHGTVTYVLALAEYAPEPPSEERPLFPRLRSLSVYHMRTPTSLSGFCSPQSLRHLNIVIEIPRLMQCYRPSGETFRYGAMRRMQEAFQSFVDCIPDEMEPFLENLESLSYEQDHGFLKDTELCERERIPFWTMTHLRSLEVSHEIELTASMLQAIMDFPHLRHLDMFVKMSITQEERERLTPGFRALRELGITGRWGHCTTFIQAISPLPPLEYFRMSTVLPRPSENNPERIRETDEATDKRLKIIWDALPATLQEMSLRLAMSGRNGGDQFHEGMTLSRLISQLRACPATGLRFLTCFLDRFSRYPTDDDMRMFFEPSVRWPDLASLQLCYWEAENIIPDKDRDPTLSTISALVGAHPHLQRLTIPLIDTREFEDEGANTDRPRGTGKNASSPGADQHVPKSGAEGVTGEGADSPEDEEAGYIRFQRFRLLRLLSLDSAVNVSSLAECLEELFPGVHVADVDDNVMPRPDENVKALEEELTKLRLSIYAPDVCD